MLLFTANEFLIEFLVNNMKNKIDDAMRKREVVCQEKREWFNGKAFEAINIRG